MRNDYKEPPKLKGLDFSEEEIEKAKKDRRLLRIGTELSRLCNLICPYCVLDSGNPLENELTKKEIKSIIGQGIDLGAKTVVIIGGGEPLLYPHLDEIIDYINSKGVYTVLFTNGTLVNKTIAERFFEKDLSVIAKLNSFNPSIQKELAGGIDCYEQMMQGIKNLMQAGFNKSKPTRLGLESIIARQNFIDDDGLLKIWRFCRDNNIFPYFEVIKEQGRAAKNIEINIGETLAQMNANLHDFFRALLCIDTSEYNIWWMPKMPRPADNCRQYGISLYVTSQGNVQYCSGVPIVLGNLRQVSLKTITESPQFKWAREIEMYLDRQCGECFAPCYGCRATAYAETDDLFASDPYCWQHTTRSEKFRELVSKRRSIRKYKPIPIGECDLIELMEVSSLAPSGCNAQPWEYRVINDPKKINQLVDDCIYWQKFIKSAPMIIIGCADTNAYDRNKQSIKEQIHEGSQPEDADVRIQELFRGKELSRAERDLVISITHIMYRAEELGFGTCPVGCFDHGKLKKYLKLPPNLEPFLSLTVGYADESPGARPRGPMGDIYKIV